MLEDQAEHVSELRHIIAARAGVGHCKGARRPGIREFRVQYRYKKADEIGPLGFDKVEFLISTNPGDPLMPLTKTRRKQNLKKKTGEHDFDDDTRLGEN